MLSLVWLKRDLRVDDHPALALAAAQGPVLPVYIVEPSLWAQADASGRQHAFLEECLHTLRQGLAAAGQPLIVRTGDAVDVLARLHAKHGFTQIVQHRAVGSDGSQAGDARAEAWARARGLGWTLVDEPMQGVPLAPPVLTRVTEGTGALPAARALRLAEDRCAFRQPGGRAAALQVLDGFLTARGQGYGTAPDALTAERAGSRLSPYLAFGVLSAREVVTAAAEARARWRGNGDWGAALRAFGARLRAREVAHAGPLMTAPAAGPEDLVLRDAWRAGCTGLPYVDAAMRALIATGWLDAASRGLLATFAIHHLSRDLRTTGDDLARLFTDHDPAIHWTALRACAGVDAMPRLPDPVNEGRRLDPGGAFIRRWLPELARVPDAHLHAPWAWPPARALLAGRYPEPVVDPASAAKAARARVRARLGARQPAAHPLLIEPTPRRREGAQMALDL